MCRGWWMGMKRYGELIAACLRRFSEKKKPRETCQSAFLFFSSLSSPLSSQSIVQTQSSDFMKFHPGGARASFWQDQKQKSTACIHFNPLWMIQRSIFWWTFEEQSHGVPIGGGVSSSDAEWFHLELCALVLILLLRSFVPLSQCKPTTTKVRQKLSDYLVSSLLIREDRNFFEHCCVFMFWCWCFSFFSFCLLGTKCFSFSSLSLIDHFEYGRVGCRALWEFLVASVGVFADRTEVYFPVHAALVPNNSQLSELCNKNVNQKKIEAPEDRKGQFTTVWVIHRVEPCPDLQAPTLRLNVSLDRAGIATLLAERAYNATLMAGEQHSAT